MQVADAALQRFNPSIYSETTGHTANWEVQRLKTVASPANCGRTGGERNRAESERQEVALSKEHKTEVRQGCRGQLEGTGR